MKGLRKLCYLCVLNGLIAEPIVAAELPPVESNNTASERSLSVSEFIAQLSTPDEASIDIEPTVQSEIVAQSESSVVMTMDDFLSSIRSSPTNTTESRVEPLSVPALTVEETSVEEEASAPSAAPVQVDPDLFADTNESSSSVTETPVTPEPTQPQSTTQAPVAPTQRLTSTPVVTGLTQRQSDIVAAASVLDLRTAIRQALSTHPAVVESMGNYYSTLGEVDEARAAYFPQVSAGFGNSYRRSASNSWNNYNLSASQMLYDFGKASSSVEAASSGADRQYAGVLLTMDDLALDTAEAFIEVQRHQELLKIAKDQVRAIADIQALADARSALGASTQSDALQALSRHESALAAELQLQAQLDLWKRTLQSFTGRPLTREIDNNFPDNLEQACLAYPESFDEVPTIIAADAALQQALAKSRKAKADLYPTISIKADYGNYGNSVDNTFNSQLNERDVSVSLNVDSTLFQGGAARARRESAEYSVRAARAGKEAAMLEVTRRFREAHDQTSSFISRLGYLESRYENIVDTQALYREQYLSLGTRTLLDILNTEEEIHQSRFERVDTIYDLRQLQLLCLHSLGQLRNAFDIEVESSMTRGN